MDHVRLGGTGLKVSRICLGIMSFGTGGAREWHLGPAEADPFVSMQNHYNLAYREEEREMIPLCVDQGVGVIPYSPLARGLLARTGSTARSGTDPVADDLYGENDLAVVDVVRTIAAEREVPMAQVALEAPYRPHPVLD